MTDKEEQLFPIYSFSIRWLEKAEPDKEYSPRQTEGAPDGMCFNSTQFYKAFRKEPNNSELERIARERCDGIRKKYSGESPVIIISFYENESWWITWFEHVTFDIGQSDEEVLASFRRFVRRKQLKGSKEHNDSGYLLMGADDEWRWHGAEPDGKPEDRSKPPCRCKYCKEQKVIRIAH